MTDLPTGSQAPAETGAGSHKSSEVAVLHKDSGATVTAAHSPAVAGADAEIEQADIDVLHNAMEDVAEGSSNESANATNQSVTPLENSVADAERGATLSPREFDLPPFETPAAHNGIDLQRVALLHDVNLRVKIELGRAAMLVEDVLKLGEGSVVELDKAAGDPVDVFVNDRLIARGEVLVLNDSFCVRISEVLANDPHRVSG